MPKEEWQKDWLFCPYSGNVLTFDGTKNIAYCESSGYQVPLKGEWFIVTLYA